jgi:thiol-disulfide isomerase/thioredoxin
MLTGRLLFISLLLSAWTITGLCQFKQPVIGAAIGNRAPEIRLPNPEGNTIALSSLKGRLVLIDFWASWCKPCLEEQPMLLTIYKKYHGKAFKKAIGFDIYGVSLDNKKSEWAGAITKLNISWIQVSDLKYWNSGAAKIYGVEELPFNALIDGDGIIIAKNLHGADLESTLLKLSK